jgi:hypothetical protein
MRWEQREGGGEQGVPCPSLCAQRHHRPFRPGCRHPAPPSQPGPCSNAPCRPDRRGQRRPRRNRHQLPRLSSPSRAPGSQATTAEWVGDRDRQGRSATGELGDSKHADGAERASSHRTWRGMFAKGRAAADGWRTSRGLPRWCPDQASNSVPTYPELPRLRRWEMVGDSGIEPLAFPVSGGRSPAELIARPAARGLAAP